MTAERILGYLQAVHAAITHKQVPFKATAFRINYGISPHINSAMLANGIIYKDLDEECNKFVWRWLADEPSMLMAGKVLQGYGERIKRYGRNAAVTRAEDEERRKAMERLALIKQGKDNKGRMADALEMAKNAQLRPIPTPENDDIMQKLIDSAEDREAKAALAEAVEVRKERQALIEMDYSTLEERVMALAAMTDEKFNALNADVQKLLGMTRRLLKLHGADGVE
jgi:hypothetical protein